jgi:hypothetical protein
VVAWTAAYTYFIKIIGILIFIVFVLIEKRASHPLIPFGVLCINFLFALVCISAGWSSSGFSVFYTLNLIQVPRERTPLLRSTQITPINISGLFAAGAAGLTSKQYPRIDSYADPHEFFPHRGCHLRDDACAPNLVGADVSRCYDCPESSYAAPASGSGCVAGEFVDEFST